MRRYYIDFGELGLGVVAGFGAVSLVILASFAVA
jgi:hypothetical protein